MERFTCAPWAINSGHFRADSAIPICCIALGASRKGYWRNDSTWCCTQHLLPRAENALCILFG